MLCIAKLHLKNNTYKYLLFVFIILSLKQKSQTQCKLMKCKNIDEYHNPPYPLKYLNITDPLLYKAILHPKLKSRFFDFIISIPVAPYDFDYRDTIRKTWNLKSNQYISFFFMGISNCTDFCSIKNELKLYNDIIQFNFINSYLNLTLLTILSMYWVINSNINFKFYIKIDRDIVPNLKNIFKLMKMKYKYRRGIYGAKECEFIVNRNRNSSSYIPYAAFNHRFSPSYIIGMLYIIDYVSLILISNISMIYRPLVYREDVHLGILCNLIGVDLINIKNIVMRKTYNYKKFCKYYSFHSYKPKDIYFLYLNKYDCNKDD